MHMAILLVSTSALVQEQITILMTLNSRSDLPCGTERGVDPLCLITRALVIIIKVDIFHLTSLEALLVLPAHNAYVSVQRFSSFLQIRSFFLFLELSRRQSSLTARRGRRGRRRHCRVVLLLGRGHSPIGTDPPRHLLQVVKV